MRKQQSFLIKLGICENHICELRSEELLREDHRSYIRNFCACEEKAGKKFRLCKPVEYIRGFYPEAIIVARLDASQDTSQTRIDSWQKGYTKGQTL